MMEFIRKFASLVLCGILIVLLILQRECSPKPQVISEYTVDTVRITADTVFKQGEIIYKPLPYMVYDTVRDTIFKTHADTLAAVKDYQLTRNYILPLFDDTTGKIDVYATVQLNKIQSWTYKGKVVNKHTTHDRHHYVKELPRTKFYVGIGAGGWTDHFGIAPGIAVNTKKQNLYTADFDLVSKTVWVHSYWQLGRK